MGIFDDLGAEQERLEMILAGEFCRVAARRVDPARTGLVATGPHGATALRLVRTYAA